jgi:hypothetical protein
LTSPAINAYALTNCLRVTPLYAADPFGHGECPGGSRFGGLFDDPQRSGGGDQLSHRRGIPSDQEIPVFIKDEFGDFYTEMFEKSYTDQNRNVAFLEYAWDMRGCDPCAADPLTSR